MSVSVTAYRYELSTSLILLGQMMMKSSFWFPTSLILVLQEWYIGESSGLHNIISSEKGYPCVPRALQKISRTLHKQQTIHSIHILPSWIWVAWLAYLLWNHSDSQSNSKPDNVSWQCLSCFSSTPPWKCWDSSWKYTRQIHVYLRIIHVSPFNGKGPCHMKPRKYSQESV
jgi:hypothetical protein